MQTNIDNFRQERLDVTGYNDNGRPSLLCGFSGLKMQYFFHLQAVYMIYLYHLYEIVSAGLPGRNSTEKGRKHCPAFFIEKVVM